MFDWIKQLWRIKRFNITVRDAATIRRILATACRRSFNNEVVLDITTGPVELDTYGERIEGHGYPAEGFYLHGKSQGVVNVWSQDEMSVLEMDCVPYTEYLELWVFILDENRMPTRELLAIWVPLAAIREMTCSYERRPDPRLREAVA